MSKNSVAVLDVGSSKVTAIVGERGVNNTFAIKSMVERKYDGFSEGQFFDIDGFKVAILESLSEALECAKVTLSTIYVGVPGTFVRLENRKYKIAFNKKKKIKQTDVDDLFEAGKAFTEIGGYELISNSAVYFALDDNRKVFDPINVVSTMLGGNLTYVLCEKYFTENVRAFLSEINIKEVVFVYDCLAEGLNLLDKSDRESPTLISDVGYICTSSAIVLGEGVVAKDAFDFGGGHVTAALLDRFSLSLEDAENLKREVNLGYSRKSSSIYTVESENSIKQFSVEEVNECVIEALDCLAGNLDAFIEENVYKTNNNLKVCITGGGISYMRGAKEHLSGRLGVPVEIIKPNIPRYNRAGYSSQISLLDYALCHSLKNSLSFTDKLMGLLSRGK